VSEEEKFDAIIVGAGPAGSACAYTLAREGKAVLLIERGVTPGSKNLTGGRLYTYALELLEPGLYAEAPLERKVVHEQVMMLGDSGALTIDYNDFGFGKDVPQSYTVLRGQFDEWLAGQAEAQGAMVASGIKVEELIEKDGTIVGVKAGDDEMYADVIIAADGVNSFIAQQAGLRPDITAHTVGVGVKEVIKLSPEVIESRFNLAPGEGTARVVLGCTEGIPGGGFLYTNQDTLSLGSVFNPEDAGNHGKKIHEMLQDFKMHPAIYPLIEGGVTVEYGAHLVPEAGWNAVPQKLFRDGLVVVGDAAGFVINSGTTIRGIDLAIVSGIAAARAVIAASSPSEVGPAYVTQLGQLKLAPSMKQFAGWPEIMTLPRLFTAYPKLATEAMQFIFTVDGEVPQKMPKGLLNVTKRHVTFGQLLADGWKGLRLL
jgi:electron transfer flavoprotein-quinone oxidoreductase